MKKIIYAYTLYFHFLFLIILSSCSTKVKLDKLPNEPNAVTILNSTDQMENGDLVFVGAIDEGLSAAIKNATFTNTPFNFDHVGLIERTKDSVFVLHAAPKGGSQRQFISDFYQEQKNDQNQLIIYRLKKEFQTEIPSAIKNAKTMLDKPYNWEYILNENSYYCSDFVERAFRTTSTFEHIPMNFKNVKTGEYDQFWIDFYQKRSLDIPQNQPGTNPNQISASLKLELIGSLNLFISK